MAGSFIHFQKEDFLGLPDYQAIYRTVERDEVKESLIRTIPEPKGRKVVLPQKDAPEQEYTVQVIKDEIGCGWMYFDNNRKEVTEEVNERGGGLNRAVHQHR